MEISKALIPWPKAISIFRVYTVVPSVLIYFSSNLSSMEHNHVGSLFYKEEQKRVGSWQCMLVSHVPGFLCVIKHREFQTKWQCSQPCFHNFQTSLLNNLYHKLAKNLLWMLLLFLFCSAAFNTNRSCDASLSVASLNFSCSVTLQAIIIIMNT